MSVNFESASNGTSSFWRVAESLLAMATSTPSVADIKRSNSICSCSILMTGVVDGLAGIRQLILKPLLNLARHQVADDERRQHEQQEHDDDVWRDDFQLDSAGHEAPQTSPSKERRCFGRRLSLLADDLAGHGFHHRTRPLAFFSARS